MSEISIQGRDRAMEMEERPESPRSEPQQSSEEKKPGIRHRTSALPPIEIKRDENGEKGDAIMEVKMQEADTPIVLQFKDLNYTITTKKSKPFGGEGSKNVLHWIANHVWHRTESVQRQILTNVTGKVMPGEILAIMGPTGSGKTTLLGLLAKRVNKGVTGEILVNGQPPSKDFKRQVAFVLQDDVFFPNLTVSQTLECTAQLRLPKRYTRKEKSQRVDEMISLLNLAKAKNTIIGGPFTRGVSGGERKRVNIGNELLTNPGIILLDEPTSGLDTSTALNLMKVLKKMAGMGYTVVTTIHQPTSQMFQLFDKLMLLVDGNVCYYGKAEEAVDYFAGLGLECETYSNPADFMMGMILEEELRKTSDVKLQLMDRYRQYSETEDTSSLTATEKVQLEKIQKNARENPAPKYPTTFFQQFYVLLGRGFYQAKGNNLARLPFLQVIVIALFVGFFWYHLPRSEERIQDKFGVIFFTVVFAGGFTPLLNTVFNFPPERAVLIRERSSGAYRLISYFLSKNVAELPFVFLFPALFFVYHVLHGATSRRFRPLSIGNNYRVCFCIRRQWIGIGHFRQSN
eukprot:TRINITY_DN2930_c0_g1_i2.p1 TRINITY_DN2930_c0_g1~~TRINITY_DN2930_c0_g1_i2.p1  ORF type:complete len:584 (-),score=153.78 TRINITY_DN2930_c0_g1_i2:408-2123(-)